MASTPARRHPSEDEPVEVGRRESFGPLELERHPKADGRALILYTRLAETLPATRSAATRADARAPAGDRAIEDPQP